MAAKAKQGASDTLAAFLPITPKRGKQKETIGKPSMKAGSLWKSGNKSKLVTLFPDFHGWINDLWRGISEMAPEAMLWIINSGLILDSIHWQWEVFNACRCSQASTNAAAASHVAAAEMKRAAARASHAAGWVAKLTIIWEMNLGHVACPCSSYSTPPDLTWS